MNHPAKFSRSIIDHITTFDHYEGSRVLDPFAGVGGIHVLQDQFNLFETVGVELEPEWAGTHPRTIVGNALHLPFPDKSFDGIITSPTYGNRMADKYDGRDGSRRITYRTALGRMPSEGSSSTMQWGEAYRNFHRLFYMEAMRVAETFLLVNVSNHIRKGKEVNVEGFHINAMRAAGWNIQSVDTIGTPRMRMGSNSNLRVAFEVVICAQRW